MKKQTDKTPKVDYGSIDLPKLDLTGFNIPKAKASRAAATEEEKQTDRAMPTRYTPPLPPITGIPCLYKGSKAYLDECEEGRRESIQQFGRRG